MKKRGLGYGYGKVRVKQGLFNVDTGYIHDR